MVSLFRHMSQLLPTPDRLILHTEQISELRLRQLEKFSNKTNFRPAE